MAPGTTPGAERRGAQCGAAQGRRASWSFQGVIFLLSLMGSFAGLEVLRSSSLGDARCGGEVVLRLEVLHVARATPWTRARADRGSPSSPSFEPA